MCYLCLKDNPFDVSTNSSDLQHKRERALEIKRLLQEAEEQRLCHIGDVTVERLREEQYNLSREL